MHHLRERLRRSLDISGCVEKCASRIFPHTQIYPLRGAVARLPGKRGRRR